MQRFRELFQTWSRLRRAANVSTMSMKIYPYAHEISSPYPLLACIGYKFALQEMSAFATPRLFTFFTYRCVFVLHRSGAERSTGIVQIYARRRY